MKTQLVLVLASVSFATVSVVTQSSSGALAGPLGEVNRAAADKQDRSNSRSSGSRGRDHQPDRDQRHDHNHRDWHVSDRHARPINGVIVLDRHHRTRNFTPAPFHVSLLASYQNVADSDGALNGDIQLAHGNAALTLSSSSYFENGQIRKGEAMTTSRLTRWDVQIQGRSLRTTNTEVWIGGGIGQLRGSEFESVTGLSLGIEAKHRLSSGFAGGFGIYGGARGMIYEDDLKATELRAGVAASVLRVGYRYFELNVGPPLQGPEVGVALQF